jgi:alkanesulfonate monooxygenase SsuD/methylene tetrahydromethanopterin reductase-like flavin-dependent oxidoreductase (luciferase family)
MTVIEIGVFLPTLRTADARPIDVVAAARHAEDLGLSSVWAVDQLVAGRGTPIVDSVVALAAAAGATERVRLGVGVMILPLRPVAWIAKQIASLQAVSNGRVLFGVGLGGDRHDLSWNAAGVPRRERGARTDAALQVLPALIAGKPARLPDLPGTPQVQLAPGVEVPPIYVGGLADSALRRAVRDADGWFALPVPPDDAGATIDRLRALAEEFGRPEPEIVASVMTAIDGDPALPSPTELTRQVTDPDGIFGIPGEAVPTMLLTGGPAAVAERLSAWSDVGARQAVVTLAAGDWHRQAELLAEAASMVRANGDARRTPESLD